MHSRPNIKQAKKQTDRRAYLEVTDGTFRHDWVTEADHEHTFTYKHTSRYQSIMLDVDHNYLYVHENTHQVRTTTTTRQSAGWNSLRNIHRNFLENLAVKDYASFTSQHTATSTQLPVLDIVVLIYLTEPANNITEPTWND